MFKKLTKNFWIKLFCLFSATILWVYIAAGQNTVAKYPGSIKIKAINVPSGMIAIFDVKTVEIKIMADPGVWSKLSSDTFSAYVDLSIHKEGTYEFPVNVVSSISGVSIVEKNPEKIIVSLEPVLTKEVSINRKVEGSAGEGLVAGNIEIQPGKATIRGPKSVINNITEATAIINLNGESEKFTKTVPLVALDDKGEVINNVEFDPAQITALVPIVKASNNKTVGIKVKTSGLPKTGYFISSITSSPATVDITGPIAILSDINYIETEPIDITNQSNNLDKDVALSVKSGIALQTGSTSRVHIKIVFSRDESTKEVVATISPTNLPTGYSISSIDPSSVRVICSGPVDTISNLKSSDVILTLNFEDKKVPDSGVLNFDLSGVNFKAPDGVSIASIVPSAIKVKLEKR